MKPRLACIYLHLMPLLGAVICVLPSFGAELELKSLGAGLESEAEARKYGPYVGVFGGATLGQDGRIKAGGRSLSFDSVEGSAIFGIEIGRSWKMKRWPLMASVEFEGMLQSTEFRGQSADAATAPGAGLTNADLVAYGADVNSIFFSLNAGLSLDLYRYRARIGNVLAGFRPYAGIGFGGGQVWYRNVSNQSRDQFRGTGTTAPNQTLFAADEFLSAWQWHVGLEWTWKDRYAAFAEYRQFNMADTDDLADFSTDGYVIGFRYRY